MAKKFDMQDSQYSFPYHHIVDFDGHAPVIQRSLLWGYEYFTYVNKVVEKVKKYASNSVVEVGCGDGYVLNKVSEVMNGEMLGVDLSEKAIAFAKAFSNGPEYRCEDINVVNKEFECAILSEVLEHIPDDALETFLNDVASVLAEGSYIVLSVPTDVRPVHKKHYRHYNLELLNEHIGLCEKKLELVEYEYCCKDDSFYRLYRRAFFNKYWNVYFRKIEKMMWNYYVKNLSSSSKEDGFHLVAVYKLV